MSNLIEMISGKLHGIKITESALNYHGSITIDVDIIKTVGFIPMEFVYIWNKNSGARISTYVLPGKAGSKVVCLNGAAARSCQIGDEVIITSVRQVSEQSLGNQKATVVTFDHSNGVNNIDEVLEYDLNYNNGDWEFDINKLK